MSDRPISEENAFPARKAMRLLIRSEPEAFRLTLAFAVVAGACILIGYLLGAVVGIALFVVVALLTLVRDLASLRSERSVLRDAARATPKHPEGGAPVRILLIAGETISGAVLSEQIIRGRAPHPVLDVVAPVLQSKAHLLTTDVDRETAAARRRLAKTLRWAADHEIPATGVIGDPVAPFAAIEDQLRRYDFDEVILATHPEQQSNWLEEEILDRAREQLSIPITHIVIDHRQ